MLRLLLRRLHLKLLPFLLVPSFLLLLATLLLLVLGCNILLVWLLLLLPLGPLLLQVLLLLMLLLSTEGLPQVSSSPRCCPQCQGCCYEGSHGTCL